MHTHFNKNQCPNTLGAANRNTGSVEQVKSMPDTQKPVQFYYSEKNSSGLSLAREAPTTAHSKSYQFVAGGKTNSEVKRGSDFKVLDIVGTEHPGVAPIQRAVKTNGGSFDTKEYKAEEDWRVASRFIGANIRLTFEPDPFLLDTDVNTIGLIQTVKTMQTKGANPPEPWSPDNKARLGLKMTRDEQNHGMGMDKRDKEDFNQGLLPVSPVYVEQAAYDPESNKIKPKTSTLKSEQPYFGKNWERGQSDNFAELIDHPRSLFIPDSRWKAEFEVAATILDGSHEGSYLGSVKWGWESDDKGKPSINPDRITLISTGTPTTDFQAAGIRWNNVMKLQPPTEDVDIFKPLTGEKIESKKGIERQVRMLPDFIETSTPPLFNKLSSEELIDIYHKLKTPKLLRSEKQQSLELAIVIRTLLSRWQSTEGMSLRKIIKEGSDLKKDLDMTARETEEKDALKKLESAKKDVASIIEEWNGKKADDYLIKAYVRGFKRDEISIEQIKTFLNEYKITKPIVDEDTFLQKLQQYFDEKEQAGRQTIPTVKVSTGNAELDEL